MTVNDTINHFYKNLIDIVFLYINIIIYVLLLKIKLNIFSFILNDIITFLDDVYFTTFFIKIMQSLLYKYNNLIFSFFSYVKYTFSNKYNV